MATGGGAPYPHDPLGGGLELDRSAEMSQVPVWGRDTCASTTSHSKFPFPFVSRPESVPTSPAALMRACTPNAAPPVARAIVTSKTIVRPVSITFPPPECRWRGAYHTAFLVRLSSNSRYSHQLLFEREPDIGGRARPLVCPPVPG